MSLVFCFSYFMYVSVWLTCLSVHYLCTLFCRGQKRVSVSQELELQMVLNDCGCSEPNLDSLGEQPVPSVAEPSLPVGLVLKDLDYPYPSPPSLLLPETPMWAYKMWYHEENHSARVDRKISQEAKLFEPAWDEREQAEKEEWSSRAQP